MNKFTYILTTVLATMLLGAPLAFAQTPSVAIQSLTPGATVTANSFLSFQLVTVGFAAQSYQLTDSFGSLSTAAPENIDPGGKFSWTPAKRDAGTHNLTIVASDYVGDSATVSLSIVVLPPPSVSLQSVSTTGNVMPGSPYSFTISAVGFTNPSYSVSDSFGGSSASSVVVGVSGNFLWTPDIAQSGEHTITVYVYDALGHSASVSQTVQVGAGPTISIPSLTPGNTVAFGTTLSFVVSALNFSPSSFLLSDSFSGSSLRNDSINTGGLFSWVPRVTDIGVHTILIKGIVGAYGKSATTTEVITVTGATTSAAIMVPVVQTPTSTPTVTALPVAPVIVATTTAPAAATGDAFVFKNFMALGEDTTDGVDVLELQKRLVVLGFLSKKQTLGGYFGAATEAAVKKFQRAHHLHPTGYVGFETRTALNKS
jgi:hypothetical protein